MSLKKFSEIGVGIAFKKVIKKGNLVKMSADLEKSGASRQIFCYRLENVYVIMKTYERANTKV